MPTFIECTTEKFDWKDKKIVNYPVNINLCFSIQKASWPYLTKENLAHKIIFASIGDSNIIWQYETIESRDEQYDLIMSTFGMKFNK